MTHSIKIDEATYASTKTDTPSDAKDKLLSSDHTHLYPADTLKP